MARYFKKRTQNKGLPPGSLIFIGTQKVEQPSIHYIEYNAQDISEGTYLTVDEVPKTKDHRMQWYNVTGLHDKDFMAEMGQRLKIHNLALEDAMNTGQRAKFSEFDDHNFITLKMLRYHEAERKVQAEQVSLVFNDDFLITLQEEPGDTFDPVRHRLKIGKLIRQSGPDHLSYALLDTIIDNYVYLVESMGEKIDDLELKVLEAENSDILDEINIYKRELHYILKVIRPVKELIHNILKSDSPFIHSEIVLPYYRDLLDITTQVLETAETYRSVLTDYMNLYHSKMSTRMNDIMKVLTIFSALFIPLSFLAAVYGTNFEHFPELGYRYSYYIFWAVMLGVAIVMLLYFKRKKWL